MAERANEPPGVPFIRALISFMKALLSKALPPDTITLEMRISTYEFEG